MSATDLLPQTTSAIIEANISSRESIIQIMFETETIIEVTSSKGMTAIARTKDGPKEGLLNTGAFTMRIMIRSRHSNRKGKRYWHKKHRAFGRSYYPATGLIYSDYLRASRHEHEHPSDFVWRQIDTFYTPTGQTWV